MGATILWAMMLGLLTLGGYIHPVGTFGRWVAPYTLSAMIGVILVFSTSQIMIVLNRFLVSQ
jgi:hypothetical protein